MYLYKCACFPCHGPNFAAGDAGRVSGSYQFLIREWYASRYQGRLFANIFCERLHHTSWPSCPGLGETVKILPAHAYIRRDPCVPEYCRGGGHWGNKLVRASRPRHQTRAPAKRRKRWDYRLQTWLMQLRTFCTA